MSQAVDSSNMAGVASGSSDLQGSQSSADQSSHGRARATRSQISVALSFEDVNAAGSVIQTANSMDEESALSAAEADVAGPSRHTSRVDNNNQRAANSQISTAMPPSVHREQYASSPKVPRSNIVVSHAGIASNRACHLTSAPLSPHVDAWLQASALMLHNSPVPAAALTHLPGAIHQGAQTSLPSDPNITLGHPNASLLLPFMTTLNNGQQLLSHHFQQHPVHTSASVDRQQGPSTQLPDKERMPELDFSHAAVPSPMQGLSSMSHFINQQLGNYLLGNGMGIMGNTIWPHLNISSSGVGDPGPSMAQNQLLATLSRAGFLVGTQLTHPLLSLPPPNLDNPQGTIHALQRDLAAAAAGGALIGHASTGRHEVPAERTMSVGSGSQVPTGIITAEAVQTLTLRLAPVGSSSVLPGADAGPALSQEAAAEALLMLPSAMPVGEVDSDLAASATSGRDQRLMQGSNRLQQRGLSTFNVHSHTLPAGDSHGMMGNVRSEGASGAFAGAPLGGREPGNAEVGTPAPDDALSNMDHNGYGGLGGASVGAVHHSQSVASRTYGSQPVAHPSGMLHGSSGYPLPPADYNMQAALSIMFQATSRVIGQQQQHGTTLDAPYQAVGQSSANARSLVGPSQGDMNAAWQHRDLYSHLRAEIGTGPYHRQREHGSTSPAAMEPGMYAAMDSPGDGGGAGGGSTLAVSLGGEARSGFEDEVVGGQQQQEQEVQMQNRQYSSASPPAGLVGRRAGEARQDAGGSCTRSHSHIQSNGPKGSEDRDRQLALSTAADWRERGDQEGVAVLQPGAASPPGNGNCTMYSTVSGEAGGKADGSMAEAGQLHGRGSTGVELQQGHASQGMPSTSIRAYNAVEEAASPGGTSYNRNKQDRERQASFNQQPQRRNNLGRDRGAADGLGSSAQHCKVIRSRDASREGSMVGVNSMDMTGEGSVDAHGGDLEEIVSKSIPWRSSPCPQGVEGASKTPQTQQASILGGMNHGPSSQPVLYTGHEGAHHVMMEYQAAPPDSSLAVESMGRSRRSGTVSGGGTVDMNRQLEEVALNDSQIANASESSESSGEEAQGEDALHVSHGHVVHGPPHAQGNEGRELSPQVGERVGMAYGGVPAVLVINGTRSYDEHMTLAEGSRMREENEAATSMAGSQGVVSESDKSSKAKRKQPEQRGGISNGGWTQRRRHRHPGEDGYGYGAHVDAHAEIECVQSADFDERLQSADAGQEQGDDNQLLVAPETSAQAVASHSGKVQGWVPEQLPGTWRGHQEQEDAAAASGSAPVWRGQPSVGPEPLNPGSSQIYRPSNQKSPQRDTASASQHKKWRTSGSPSEGHAATLSGAMPQVTEVHGAFPPHDEQVPGSKGAGYEPRPDLQDSHFAESAGRQLPQEEDGNAALYRLHPPQPATASLIVEVGTDDGDEVAEQQVHGGHGLDFSSVLERRVEGGAVAHSEAYQAVGAGGSVDREEGQGEAGGTGVEGQGEAEGLEHPGASAVVEVYEVDIDEVEGQGEAGPQDGGIWPGSEDYGEAGSVVAVAGACTRTGGAGVHASRNHHHHGNSSEVNRGGDVHLLREGYRAEHAVSQGHLFDQGRYASRAGSKVEGGRRESDRAEYELSGGPAAAEGGTDTGGCQASEDGIQLQEVQQKGYHMRTVPDEDVEVPHPAEALLLLPGGDEGQGAEAQTSELLRIMNDGPPQPQLTIVVNSEHRPVSGESDSQFRNGTDANDADDELEGPLHRGRGILPHSRQQINGQRQIAGPATSGTGYTEGLAADDVYHAQAGSAASSRLDDQGGGGGGGGAFHHPGVAGSYNNEAGSSGLPPPPHRNVMSQLAGALRRRGEKRRREQAQGFVGEGNGSVSGSQSS